MYYKHRRQVLATGQPRRCEVRLERTDAGTSPVELVGVKVRNADGTIEGCHMSLVDISARKQAEEALRKEHDLTESVLQTAQAIVLVLDPQGRIVRFNPYMEKLSGYPLADVTGRDWFDTFLPERDRKRIRGLFTRVVGGAQTNGAVNSIVTKDGEERDIEWYDSTLKDAEGNVTGVVAIGHDITERKRSEEVLRSNEEKFRAIVEHIGIGVALISPKMEILELNQQMRTWFPKVAPDQHPICYSAFNHPSRNEICEYCPTWKTLQDGEVHEAFTETPQEGGIRHYRIVSSAIHDRIGAVVAAVEMVEDVTERRKLEAQLVQAQKMEAVGQLSAGVAHDFNNSLMAILGYAEVACLMLPAGHPAAKDLDGIVAVVTQATGVTKSLLTFSRDTPLDVAPVNLGRFVHDSSRMLQRMLPAAIEMIIEAAKSSELWIRADGVQLNQVLMNLVVNARDAMPDGGRLRIQVLQEPPESADAWTAIATRGLGVVRLVVEDTGGGMSAEVLARVCDPFFTTKPRGQGTGLGMSIVHGIVESHQAHMQIESEEGRCTRIAVRFPRCEPSVAAGAAALPPADVSGCEATILVAEDNEQVRAVIATALESSGFTVLEACDGAEASRLFEERKGDIALAVLDVDMPGKSGKACMREFHDRRPTLPIVLITGFQDKSITDGEPGDVLLLRKPFSPHKLIRLVGEMLTKAPAAKD